MPVEEAEQSVGKCTTTHKDVKPSALIKCIASIVSDLTLHARWVLHSSIIHFIWLFAYEKGKKVNAEPVHFTTRTSRSLLRKHPHESNAFLSYDMNIAQQRVVWFTRCVPHFLLFGSVVHKEFQATGKTFSLKTFKIHLCSSVSWCCGSDLIWRCQTVAPNATSWDAGQR